MPTLATLVSFDTTNGQDPQAGLAANADGDLFGTTYNGGTSDHGTVFEIAKTNGGYANTPTILVSFSNAVDLAGTLLIDAAGNLFGATSEGGANGGGTVYEIAKTVTGYAAPTTLVNFNASSEGSPQAGLIADAAGDLFGTAQTGGGNNGFTVFEVAKTSTGYAITPTILATFAYQGSAFPMGGLVMDAAGDLFGTTPDGGPNNDGTVFEIAKTSTGYAAVTTLVNFNGGNGSLPTAALTLDAAGNLFGTTQFGGASDAGTVFEIAKNPTGYATTPTTLTSFNVATGADPVGGLLIDGAGNLFGTTSFGEDIADEGGTVFEIAKTASGYASTPITLIGLNGSLANLPFGPDATLFADANGNLYGTSANGGTNDAGTVFEVSGTGFQVACYLSGTRIATPTGERPIESLAAGDLVLTQAGEVRSVVWMGHRRLDCCRHPKPWDVWPVRVRAGAFGVHMPRRDLLLSPDHSVFVGDALIPVRYVINGATIVQERADSVTYWHVQLDRHDVILAEGLPCETYLDTGNRGAFANGGATIQMHPDFALRIWDAEAFAPLVLGGARLVAAKRRLLAQAGSLGHATDGDPELKILIDGVVAPAETHGRLWRVRLPGTAGHARLVSRVWIPAQMRPDDEDTRSLGIAISRLWLDGREVSLQSHGLFAGWHAPEPGWRWTDGDAGLALPDARELAFEVAMTGTYWQDEQRRQVQAV